VSYSLIKGEDGRLDKVVFLPRTITSKDDVIVSIYCVVCLDRSLSNIYTTQRRRLGRVTDVNTAMFGEQTPTERPHSVFEVGLKGRKTT
jgi:hypothetical protein